MEVTNPARGIEACSPPHYFICNAHLSGAVKPILTDRRWGSSTCTMVTPLSFAIANNLVSAGFVNFGKSIRGMV
jgi:hypothetical protein